MQATHYLKQAGIDCTQGRPGRHRRDVDRAAPAAHAHPGGVEIGRIRMFLMRMSLGRNAPI